MAYNVTGWLEKNKDPVNESVIEQLRKGGNQLLSQLFDETSESNGGHKSKRGKGSTFQTVSALYKVLSSNFFRQKQVWY